MATLVASSLVSFLAFALLLWVGRVVAERPASSRHARLASSMFAAWWYALAASTGATALTDGLTAVADPPLSLVMGLQFLSVAAVCMGLAGLLYYLVYLYTGRTGSFWPLVAGYALFAGVLIQVMAAWEPVGVVAAEWGASIDYARPASDATVLMLLLVLIGPQLAASVALFLLAARLPDSAARVRLLVVATAIFAWFGSTLLATAVGATSNTAWQVLQLWIPVLVGLGVLLAHRPPLWLEARMPPELPAEPVSRLRTRSD